MISIVNTIRNEEKENFYLIGVDKLDLNSDLLDHEMKNGFYYTDIKYRNNATI